ncbi:serine hydrolase [Mariniluteicoccus flavus]
MLELPPLTDHADWSIALRDAATGEVLAARDPDRVLKTASIGKVFLLVEAASRLEAGTQDPAEPLTWTDDELVADSGLWYLMASRHLPFADLCLLIGAFSDNLATNVLVRHLGLDAPRDRARELGCRESALLDRIRSERLPGMPPTLSVGCAGELSDVMARLDRGDAVSPAVSERVLRWLGADADLSMVAAAYGLDPLAHDEPDRGIHLINKTGTISTARVDIGLVRGPRRTIAYAVGANWADDVDPRDAVLADMRAVGDLIGSVVA